MIYTIYETLTVDERKIYDENTTNKNSTNTEKYTVKYENRKLGLSAYKDKCVVNNDNIHANPLH